jgi:hypothetical protein
MYLVINIINKETDDLGTDVIIELIGSRQGTKTGFNVLVKRERISLMEIHSQEVFLNLVNNVIYK